MSRSYGESIVVVSDDSSSWMNFLDYYKKQYHIKDNNIFVANESCIKISHIRSIKNKLSLMPSDGELVVAVIFDAQNMTRDAQNSFLKILEEPPYYARIILFVKNIYGLLPTIVSRCKKTYIPRKLTKNIPADTLSEFRKIDTSAYIYEKIAIADELAKDENIDIPRLLKYFIYYEKSKDKIDYTKVKKIVSFKDKYKLGVNKKLFLENLLVEI